MQSIATSLQRLIIFSLAASLLSLPNSSLADAVSEAEAPNSVDQEAMDEAARQEVQPQLDKYAAERASRATAEDFSERSGATSATKEAIAEAATEAIATCEAKERAATLMCATPSLIGLSGGQGEAAGAAMAMVPMLMQQMVQAKGNNSKQCKLQKTMNQAMGVISSIKGGACAAAMMQCKSACTLETQAGLSLAEKNRAARSVALCKSYTVSTVMAAVQAGMSFNNASQLGNCAEETAAINIPKPTPYVVPTPIGGCENPQYASTNPVCICQADPKNKICGGGNNAWNAGGAAGGTSNAGGISTPDSDDFADLGDGQAVDTSEIKPNTLTGSKGSGDGNGGGPQSAGGGGGLNGMGGEGGGAAAETPAVITGQSSGGGGGNSLLGSGSTSGGGGRGMASKDDDGTVVYGLIPKGGYANRATAGMTIPAVDGATGPMGPTLWEKVSNQVQNQDSKLPFLK